MFTQDYFSQLSMTLESVHQYVHRMSGQPLYMGSPRVEILLSDGTKYLVRSFLEEPGAKFAEGVLTFLAYGPSGVPYLFVSVPYETIVRVTAYEPPKEGEPQRMVGFKIGEPDEKMPG